MGRTVSLFIDIGCRSSFINALGNEMWIDRLRDKIIKYPEGIPVW